jgi:hypothetical protein
VRVQVYTPLTQLEPVGTITYTFGKGFTLDPTDEVTLNFIMSEPLRVYLPEVRKEMMTFTHEENPVLFMECLYLYYSGAALRVSEPEVSEGDVTPEDLEEERQEAVDGGWSEEEAEG